MLDRIFTPPTPSEPNGWPEQMATAATHLAVFSACGFIFLGLASQMGVDPGVLFTPLALATLFEVMPAGPEGSKYRLGYNLSYAAVGLGLMALFLRALYLEFTWFDLSQAVLWAYCLGFYTRRVFRHTTPATTPTQDLS